MRKPKVWIDFIDVSFQMATIVMPGDDGDIHITVSREDPNHIRVSLVDRDGDECSNTPIPHHRLVEISRTG